MTVALVDSKAKQNITLQVPPFTNHTLISHIMVIMAPSAIITAMHSVLVIIRPGIIPIKALII